MSNSCEYFNVKTCRCCGGSELELVLDLGEQPPANSYHKPGENLPKHPLALNVCKACFHGQLSVVVNPNALFRHYLYVSGTSKTGQEYFKWFAKIVDQQCNPREIHTRPKVLDIASNDGTQLDHLQALGWDTYGVDPAENLAEVARAKGHKITADYWTEEVAAELPQFDAIIAQNVFAHTHDLLGFLLACKHVMHNKTTLFIQTSQAHMFEQNEFDTIYHEHLSFFNTKSMKTIVERAGMHLNHVSKTDIHGTSYVFNISREPMGIENVDEFIADEQFRGLYDMELYHQFATNAHNVKTDFQSFIRMMAPVKMSIVGYGAAAKGMTFLNFTGTKLDYIVDHTPLKQGLLTPGMDIPIYDPSVLTLEPEDVVIIPLAWNFYSEIRANVKASRPNHNDVFVRYFPKMQFDL